MTTAQQQATHATIVRIVLDARELHQIVRGMNDSDARVLLQGLEQIADGCAVISQHLKKYER